MSSTPDSLPPKGFRIDLTAGVRRYDGGRLLVGGTPTRVIRLSDAGFEVLDSLCRVGVTSSVSASLARRLCDAGLGHPKPQRRDINERIGVVIPINDQGQQLDQCLDALGLGRLVTVIDDGSVDAAGIADRCASHGANLVRLGRNQGPAAARNRGIDVVVEQHPAVEVIAFVDADVRLTSQDLSRLLGHFDDPGVVAAAPRVIEVNHSGPSMLDLGVIPDQARDGGVVSYVPSACLLVRADALTTFRFDDTLRWGEDVDLVWRLIDAGHRVVYDPTVVAVHEPPVGRKALLRKKFGYGSSAGPLAVRHGRRLAPIRLTPALATAALVATGHSRAAAVTAAWSVRELIGHVARGQLPSDAALAIMRDAYVSSLRAMSRTTAQFLWPALAVAAVRRPRTAPVMAMLIVIDPVLRWRELQPPQRLAGWIGDSLAADAAYGAGVLAGAIRSRRWEPVTPQLRRAARTRRHL